MIWTTDLSVKIILACGVVANPNLSAGFSAPSICIRCFI